MKKVSKKSALEQLNRLYCAIHVDLAMFSSFGLKLCTLYAWTENNLIQQTDIDSLRNMIINYVKIHINDFTTRFDIISISVYLNYDFNV